MKKISRLSIALLCCVFPFFSGMASAETIRELVTVHGAVPVRLNGWAIVTGLANTGDKSRGAIKKLREYMSNGGFNLEESDFAVGNVAVVSVSAEMPPFSRPGQRFNVTVSSVNDAKSLAGGQLEECSLYYGNENVEVARANGIVSSGAGGLTSGIVYAGINSGALQIEPYPYGLESVETEGVIRLNVNEPNWNDANAIARQINQTPSLNPYLQESSMFSDPTPTRPVAQALDAGQVRIEIPPQYRYNYQPYIDNILKVPVAVDRPAKILVSRGTNSIVVTGDIRVNNASVSLQDKTVTIRPETPERPAGYVLENDTPRTLVELDGPGSYADLQGLIDTLNAMGLTTEQIITIFLELRSAGAIHAELSFQP